MQTEVRLLYVGTDVDGPGIGGREQLSQLNRDALSALYGNNLDVLGLPRTKINGARAIPAIFRGHVDGVSPSTIERVLAAIAAHRASKVFLDGSNLGSLARAIKRARPEVELISFFHNCEARFFLGACRRSKSLRSVAVLAANYIAERHAVAYSDKRICLNQRDSGLVSRLYGRGATHVSAMALHDRLDDTAQAVSTRVVNPYVLFVGGTFYANLQGIEWYVDQVAGQAPIRTCVVGKGFERWKTRLERNGNVEVVGAVADLAPWYLGARLVIAPIFDGSGMKTKVAEALMFGKRVVGTPEAFVGYESVTTDIGRICVNPRQFLDALASEATAVLPSVDRNLRHVYQENYSFDAATRRLAAIIAS